MHLICLCLKINICTQLCIVNIHRLLQVTPQAEKKPSNPSCDFSLPLEAHKT